MPSLRFLPLLGTPLTAALFAVQSPAPSLPAPELSEQWRPVPVTVYAPANGIPSDALVLFDGRSLEAWVPVKAGSSGWKVEDGAFTVVPKSGALRSKAAFGDIQLHLEFRSPAVVKGRGQGRGNSGVFFMGKYELQVLDSWENVTYVNGQASSIYKQHPPLVNASRPPGEWQTYDVIFIAPRFTRDGQLHSPARITVLHNGVLVHHNVEIRGGTSFRGAPRYEAHAEKLPLELQDHSDLVSYRNIWVRELPGLSAP